MVLYFDNTQLDIPDDDRSYRYREIMGEQSVTLYFSLTEYIEIPEGAYCIYQAERYTLNKPASIAQNSERNYEYVLILEGEQHVLGKYKLRNTVDRRLKFSYTGRPHEHLQLLVDNLNSRDSGWQIGEYVDAVETCISYNHNFCNDALQMIAEAFQTEWEIRGKTIFLRKVEYNKENPLDLAYGCGKGFKTGVKRDNSEDSAPAEILYVQGGEKNIDASKYRSQELLLPKNQKLTYEGRTYIVDADGFSIRRADKELKTKKEDSVDLSKIYPKRVGEVTQSIAVDPQQNFYDFIDNSIPEDLDYNKYLIEGEKITVIFQSGMLAGREAFEVKYRHSDRRFQIVPKDDAGQIMPNEVFCPRISDKYAVFGCMLPDEYICDNATQSGASWEMFREAAKFLYEKENPRFSFTGNLDGIWSKKDWLNIGGKIILGGHVRFTANFVPEGILIRIKGIKDYLVNPYSPTIELSNTTAGNAISSELRKISQGEVVAENNRKELMQFTKRRFRDAQESTTMLKSALLNFSESINPVAINAMQILLGDESLQFIFVNNKSNPTQITHNIVYNAENKILTAPAGILKHMTLGINSLSSSHKASDYKYWDMAEFNSPPLTNIQAYYLYAKVSKTDTSGVFYLSPKAIGMNDIDGFYHLFVGILNSEFDNSRSWTSFYGFSELTPGRLTIPLIVSPDGKTYFDVAGGEIGGRIVFKSKTGVNKTLPELEEAAETYAQEHAQSEIAKFGSTIIEGGYLKNEMIDTDNLLVKNIYSKGGKFKTLADGTMYAVGGIFSGYLRTPLVSLEESDAVWDSSRHVFRIKDNLNIMSDGMCDTYHSYEDWIELPFDTKYIGSRIVILNNRFPPYTRTPGSAARTVLLVSSASKDVGIGIGGKPKTGSYQDIDPNAVEILGRAVELLCVPYRNSRVYWILTNWDNQIVERIWE